MVPHESARGRSFAGCAQYYLHDHAAETSERVGWTHVVNIKGVKDADKALRWMAFTAMSANEAKDAAGATGRRNERPVWTTSLSYHPEQSPTKEQMINAATSWLAAQNLDEHQAVLVNHTDRPHSHVHIIVNLVHPVTGFVAETSHSKLKSSRWAEAYELENGGKIYCEKRVENNAKRAEKTAEQTLDTKARITALYHASDTGAAFAAAVTQAGLTLAKGDRLVLVDGNGKVHSLSRQIDGVNARAIRAKLADLELPDVWEAQSRLQAEKLDPPDEITTAKAAPDRPAEQTADEKETPQRQEAESEYFDREAQDQQWQASIAEAAIESDVHQQPSPQSTDKVEELQSPGQSSEVQNDIPNGRLEELSRFHSIAAGEKANLAAALEARYGAHERQLRGDAERLARILENSGRMRLFWLRLTRQIPKTAREDLEMMRANLAVIEQRRTESVKRLEDDLAARRQAIEERRQEEHQSTPAESKPKLAPQSERDFGAVFETPDFDDDFGPTFDL